MKTKINLVLMLAIALTLTGARVAMAQQSGAGHKVSASRPSGPCDIYAAGGDPCVAAYSTTRAMYAGYNGPLYQVKRQSDGKSLNIGVVRPSGSQVGGYANAAAQDAFCANTYCWITKVYDQSPKHNDLVQAPRGNFSGPAMGGLNNVPVADMAPVMVMGHKVYGVFIEPGMGLRNDDPKGTAVDDQAEGQYWVINGKHFNSGCCFDFGNAEIDSHDDDAGTMETAYFGNAPWWYHGTPPGPWVMTDQENNLVGCSNPDGSKACNLPNIEWRFVTGVAKGEPHHWTSMGGDAQNGRLSVMFSGPRINELYDPMRKQGAILLGNGGDNSESSQGTFYEGAMTAAGTFPTDATDQRVQANIVAAGYRELPLSLAPASARATPPGLQTFSPRSSQKTVVTFTNTTGATATGVTLSLSVPSGWSAVVAGTRNRAVTIAHPVAPGASVNATFHVTSGPAAFNGDIVGHASWRKQKSGGRQVESLAEKVRNVPAVKINEFRVSTGDPANPTNSFIELYNAGHSSVDISRWTLTEHAQHHAIFSAVRIPAGKRLAPGGFYLLGLSDSGLATAAHAGDATLYVSSTAGMKAGDTIGVGTGASRETRKIARVGSAAGDNTTLWQPLPDGFITVPAGSTNVPVMSVAGFKVGEKIALGYGATYPTDPQRRERYEVVTVTKVGKPGSQEYLAADAPAGATNIKVTSVKDISVGDKIRLDIDSVGHGIETVTVTKIGRPASRAKLMEDVSAGATSVKIFQFRGQRFTVGDTMRIGTPATWKTATITGVTPAGKFGSVVSFKPALPRGYAKSSDVVDVGTGLDLAAPLRFHHSSNLPFADRGTGISFEPATKFVHISDEPVQPLGSGITLDRALARNHGVDAVVRDASVTTAGYQGAQAPSQWFGGPVLSPQAGSMVLRNASGLVVDSLNYGGLVDPWAAEGYQAESGFGASGCYVATPGSATGAGVSAGRLPDGADTDSNCSDFVTTPVTDLAAAAAAGASNIKVASVDGFGPGQTIRIGSGENLESIAIAKVGTAGATTLRTAAAAGLTIIPVATARGFRPGQTISIGSGANRETAKIVTFTFWRGATITIATPLQHEHAAGDQVSGSGITLASPLSQAHAVATPVAGGVATPGAANHYYRSAH